MAVVLTLKWPGYTKGQYDQLLELADWENEPARNGIFHVVWWEGDTMGIVDRTDRVLLERYERELRRRAA